MKVIQQQLTTVNSLFFPGLIEFSLILTAFKSAYTAERLMSEEGYNVIEKALRNKP